MMKIQFIKSSKKKKIIQFLTAQFGISKLPYLLIKAGKEKIRAFSGHISKEEIQTLNKLTNIEIIGLYLLKKEQDFRLSLDATHILEDQITKNILKINDSQFKDWIRGHDLEIQAPKGTLVIKHNEDFLGCTKSNGQKAFNYIPKNRRLKK